MGRPDVQVVWFKRDLRVREVYLGRQAERHA